MSTVSPELFPVRPAAEPARTTSTVSAEADDGASFGDALRQAQTQTKAQRPTSGDKPPAMAEEPSPPQLRDDSAGGDGHATTADQFPHAEEADLQADVKGDQLLQDAAELVGALLASDQVEPVVAELAPPPVLLGAAIEPARPAAINGRLATAETSPATLPLAGGDPPVPALLQDQGPPETATTEEAATAQPPAEDVAQPTPPQATPVGQPTAFEQPTPVEHPKPVVAATAETEQELSTGVEQKPADAKKAVRPTKDAAEPDPAAMAAAPTDATGDGLAAAAAASLAPADAATPSDKRTSKNIHETLKIQGIADPTGTEAPAPTTSQRNDSTASAIPNAASDDAAATSATQQVDRARFVQRVARAFEAVGDRGGSLRLRLSPPELGQLRLEISVRHGALTAQIEAETSAARDLLLQNLPQLRERLAQQDIRIERFDVDLTDRSLGSDSGQAAYQQHQPQPRPPGAAATAAPRTTLAAPVAAGGVNFVSSDGQSLNVII